MTSELIAIGYETGAEAEDARKTLLEMDKDHLVDVADAVVATADEGGRVKLNQMVNLWSVGAAGGAFWGLMIGLLFFNPLIGAVAGAGVGALSGALTDYGINDQFMRQVSEVLQPGHAALFLMVRDPAPDRVIERLGTGGGRVLRTNLDHSKKADLRRAFAKAYGEVPEVHGQAA